MYSIVSYYENNINIDMYYFVVLFTFLKRKKRI